VAVAGAEDGVAMGVTGGDDAHPATISKGSTAKDALRILMDTSKPLALERCSLAKLLPPVIGVNQGSSVHSD
jgi:hypothetical protein